MWLWSVEKEPSLIFQWFMARYSCWQRELWIFYGGPLLLTRLCFQLLWPGTTPIGNLSGCSKDTGHQGSSVPRHVALVQLLFPFPIHWTERHHPGD